jgi:hypothetical protein
MFYVGALSGPKASVCDPFLGSATTACACVRLGGSRRFWGAEVGLPVATGPKTTLRLACPETRLLDDGQGR